MLYVYSVFPLEGTLFGVREAFCFDTRGGESIPSEHTGTCRLAFRRGPPVRAQYERRHYRKPLLMHSLGLRVHSPPKILSNVRFPCNITPHLHERLLGAAHPVDYSFKPQSIRWIGVS